MRQDTSKYKYDQLETYKEILELRHIKTKTLDAQFVLHLNGNRGIGALGVGTGNDHGIDFGRGFSRRRHRVACRIGRDFRLNAKLIVGSFGEFRPHSVDVQHALSRKDVSRLYTR